MDDSTRYKYFTMIMLFYHQMSFHKMFHKRNNKCALSASNNVRCNKYQDE